METLVQVQLEGHLLESDLRDALEGAMKRADSERCAMLIDCLAMSSYEMDARHAFVSWQKAHKDRVRAVAIVTKKTLWHMVVSAMGVASGQPMKAFDEPATARAWLIERLESPTRA